MLEISNLYKFLIFIFYIDESGTNLKDKGKGNYFILASVAIDVNDCLAMSDKVSTLKREIFRNLKPEDWEIKGRDIRQGTKSFESKNWRERITIFENIASILSTDKYSLFAILANKEQAKNTISDLDDDSLYRITFDRLLDELNTFLVEKDTQGFLLLDSRSSQSSSVQDRRLIDAYLDWFSKHSTECRFVELPMFGSSNFYPGLQLADFFAYLINSIFDEPIKDKVDKLLLRPDETRQHQLQEAFNVLEKRIVKLLKIFPEMR